MPDINADNYCLTTARQTKTTNLSEAEIEHCREKGCIHQFESSRVHCQQWAHLLVGTVSLSAAAFQSNAENVLSRPPGWCFLVKERTNKGWVNLTCHWWKWPVYLIFLHGTTETVNDGCDIASNKLCAFDDASLRPWHALKNRTDCWCWNKQSLRDAQHKVFL